MPSWRRGAPPTGRWRKPCFSCAARRDGPTRSTGRRFVWSERALDSTRRHMRTRAYIALLALAIACGRVSPTEPRRPGPQTGRSVSNEFRRLELPGFSVDIPTGLGTGTGDITSYGEGRFRLEGYRRRFGVSWS